MTKYQPLAGVLTEEEVLEFLGLKKEQLAKLRYDKKLPFVDINRNKRLYMEKDLLEWFGNNTRILNRDT